MHNPKLPNIRMVLLPTVEVAVLPPLIGILLQYICLTLFLFHVSPLTGIMGLAPMCLVEFLPPLSLLLQFL